MVPYPNRYDQYREIKRVDNLYIPMLESNVHYGLGRSNTLLFIKRILYYKYFIMKMLCVCSCG